MKTKEKKGKALGIWTGHVVRRNLDEQGDHRTLPESQAVPLPVPIKICE
jgi:hypothetical protein